LSGLLEEGGAEAGEDVVGSWFPHPVLEGPVKERKEESEEGTI